MLNLSSLGLTIGDRQPREMWSIKVLVTVFFLANCRSADGIYRGRTKGPPQADFKWKTVAYRFTSKSEKELIGGYPYYTRENIIPTAIAYLAKTNMLFVAAPRLKPGVVATLNSLDLCATYHLTSPIWSPYPSYEFNELKDSHFPEPESSSIDADDLDDDCLDNWKKGPGFCRGYYYNDRKTIPAQYLPDNFISYRGSRNVNQSQNSTQIKIRISSTFPQSDSRETGRESGGDDDDTFRSGLRSLRKLKTLISVNYLAVDKCDRLWFIDTGVLEYGRGHDELITVQRPSLWVVDVSRKDLFLVQRRFEFDNRLVENGNGLRGFAVDVRDSCDGGMAYIANGLDQRLVVYDMRREDAWYFEDKSFSASTSSLHFPRMNIEVNFGVTDVAVGWKDSDKYKSIYYIPFASTKLFVVSSGSLRKVNFGEDLREEFKFIGRRGSESQSESIVFDDKRGILFFAEAQTRSVKCWNIQRSLKRSNIGTVLAKRDLKYPAHISIDGGGNLWVLSNRLPMFLEQSYNHDQYNIHIYRLSVKDIIKDTVCE